jgi:alkylated DNA repair dioxygenase AlkB
MDGIKRKTLDDYFLGPKRQRISHDHAKYVTLGISLERSKVPGLELHADFVTPEEEIDILSFLNGASKCKWRTDLTRRCMHFGGTYCLFKPPSKAMDKENPESKPEIIQAPHMPPELNWLLDRFVTRGIFPQNQRPQYCIVNEYTGAQGISAHVENFSFAEPVVGLSLLCPVSMRFHEMVAPDGGSVRSGKAAQAAKTGRKADVVLPGRSLCVMRGESRWKWQHEICRVKKGRVGMDGAEWKRFSLTFRFKDEHK